MHRLPRLVLAIALAAHGLTLFAQPPAYDLVLRNARIVEGTGSPWYRGDVAVRGDTIVRIAPAITEPATRVIDIGGQVVAPGFIDRGVIRVGLKADLAVFERKDSALIPVLVDGSSHQETAQ